MHFHNGGELVNPEIRKWASEKGIIIETMAPYSPSQNGIMERFNRTLLELTHAMLIEKRLPAFLWDEAVAHAVYLQNRAPTQALKGMTPMEAWSGTKPNQDLAKFAFNENEEPRLETSSNVPGLPAEGELAKVTDQSHGDSPNQADHKEESDTQPAKTRRLCTREMDINYRNLHNPQAWQPARQSQASTQPPPVQETSTTEHANLVFEPLQAFMEDFLEKLIEMSFEGISGVKMLRTAWEALESAEGEQWGTAMDEELARLREMGTWELTEDMPEGHVPISNRWVFTKKKDEHGNTI